MDIQTALAAAISKLSATSDSPQADSHALLAFCLNKPRSYLLTWPEQTLTNEQSDQFTSLIKRRQHGEPVAYLTGKKEFWSMALEVSPATLIPRPETELLVELALQQLPTNQESTALDLGTGSGAIALAIAKERPRCRVCAIDSSEDALVIAQKNQQRLNIKNANFLNSHWFNNIGQQRFDVIAANPPYVAPKDPHLTQGDLRFEPTTALSTANNGLADLFHIAQNARKHLKPNGWLIMEHGYDQSTELVEQLTILNYRQVTDQKDYNDQPRVICGRH